MTDRHQHPHKAVNRRGRPVQHGCLDNMGASSGPSRRRSHLESGVYHCVDGSDYRQSLCKSRDELQIVRNDGERMTVVPCDSFS